MSKETDKKTTARFAAVDVTGFADLTEDEQVAKAKEILTLLAPKRQQKD